MQVGSDFDGDGRYWHLLAVACTADCRFTPKTEDARRHSEKSIHCRRMLESGARIEVRQV
jgi:hypothetical protein